ncbi:hypothetical protein [Paenibacillus mucilaginosus]|nr:hypothetical protein [Paenibacillus mucilaginosus]
MRRGISSRSALHGAKASAGHSYRLQRCEGRKRHACRWRAAHS